MPAKTSRKKTFIVIALSAVLAIGLLALKPLPRATADNCRKQIGTVAEVAKGSGAGDIVIRLREDDHYYYINRGLEHGLSIDELESKLMNKVIEISTIKHWTPLDAASHTRHVAEILCDGIPVYSEFGKD